MIFIYKVNIMNKKQEFIEYKLIEGEKWKNINGYDNYEISNYGRVKIGQYIIVPVERYGYDVVKLNRHNSKKKDSFLVHRLVADAFLPNKENKPEVDHIDTNKKNNNYKNLRWCWHLENMIGNKTTLSKLNNGYKKKVIYESIRQDLYYSIKLNSKINYDNDVKQIVFDTVKKTTDELLTSLSPSNFGNKTISKLHTEEKNEESANYILFTINDLRVGMNCLCDGKKCIIDNINGTNNSITVKYRTGKKEVKKIKDFNII